MELVDFYGKTSANQKEIVVAVRLGGYGSLNTGTADFDDFSMEEVAAVPAGVQVFSVSPDDQHTSVTNHATTSSHTGFFIFTLVFSLLYVIICIRMVAKAPDHNSKLTDPKNIAPTYIGLLMFAGFVLRTIGAPLIQGHPIDFIDFSAWSDHAFSAGLPGFYNDQMFVDYPPGYIYILYVIGAIKQIFSLNYQSAAATILIKLPAIIADLLTSYLIYGLAKKHMNHQVSALFAFLYLLNPAIYLNSTVWGQIDSVYTLVIFFMITALTDQKVPKAAGLLALAFLIKPQAIIFTPLLLYPLITQKNVKTWVSSLAMSAVVFVLGVLPFSLHKPWYWILDLYKSMFLSYPYASLNAANLYTLFGFNGSPASTKWLFMSMSTWGNIIVVAIVAITAFLFFKSRDNSRFYYSAFLICLLVFVFKTGMHERYGYPVVLLSLISYLGIKDKRILYLFISLSFTQFANVAYIFKYSLDQQYFTSGPDIFMKIVSLCHVILAVYAIYVGWEIYIRNNVQLFKSRKSDQQENRLTKSVSKHTELQKQTSTPMKMLTKLTKKDKTAMTVLTLLYAAIALYQLGSFSAPQKDWKPKLAQESFYVDFNHIASINRIMWYGGIGDGDFQIEQSNDSIQWRPVTTISLNGGTVFQWKQSSVSFSAQFAKITVVKPGASLYELTFMSDQEKEPILISKQIPLNMGNDSLAQAQNLFNEPGTVPRQPSFMNSMYFDEIYHARTAFEHLHSMEPYETTHPPLGKVLISMGIAMFGMNPFGWRIVGTLFGIAMIPLMYLFAKKLFGKSEYGFIAAFLLACDFMHFTQTRIATIDVYGVFFIMMMYYFMYKYYVLSLSRAPLKTALISLSLSGLFFGIGAACKWIDLYAGAGLAVILGLVLYEKYKEYRHTTLLLTTQAKHKSNTSAIRQTQTLAHSFPPLLWKTICTAFVMFALVPVVIYTLSYIPFLRVPGPGHDLSAVLSFQKFMYNYHSHLVATHPFASSWWEWPIIRKPIWYYGQVSLSPDQVSSIVAMGNPAIWWPGILAVFAAFYICVKTKEKWMMVVLIGLAAEYVPWVGVPRLTFIYHFFATVPFMILCITYVIKYAHEHLKLRAKWIYMYLGTVLLMFIMFYPVLSGAVVNKNYVSHFLKWSSSWTFF
ncbi:glycosyltransferase family 39 protein [Paenibacillus alginolyticus]|uniref:Glycosyltransferase family 39 protein n=1 Tax=Paenibacillus alginolyticus TaxID=59839 RepID=A0ABT4GL81_9BACL|nr:glycosyltransferase family 39 protein [Paenibacillus alginolyticus]MCY9696804.1 glycosyltransferase family 39 protein [Paenibacillus alginolyticus]MEC0147682.1 glycosyltransferase family 39 protein [Paenibacillus alginolyticus]